MSNQPIALTVHCPTDRAPESSPDCGRGTVHPAKAGEIATMTPHKGRLGPALPSNAGYKEAFQIPQKPLATIQLRVLLSRVFNSCRLSHCRSPYFKGTASSTGFSIYLVRWTRSRLRDRHGDLVVDGRKMRYRLFKEGLLQGSTLAPIFLLLSTPVAVALKHISVHH